MTFEDTFPPFCHLEYNKHKSDISQLNISDIDTYLFLFVCSSTIFWHELANHSKFGCFLRWWKVCLCKAKKFSMYFPVFNTFTTAFTFNRDTAFLPLNYKDVREKSYHYRRYTTIQINAFFIMIFFDFSKLQLILLRIIFTIDIYLNKSNCFKLWLEIHDKKRRY